MAEEAEWAAYFYPDSEIFRNKLDLPDERLWEAERFLAQRRADQLRAGIITVPRTLDLDHLRAIHRTLFSDVYDWAGELRTVTLGKRVEDGEPARWFIGPRQLEPWFAAIADHIRAQPWSELNRSDLVHEIADVATLVNYAHIFRDGSGRSSRIFLEHIVEGTAYRLDFDEVESQRWNEASRDSIRPGRAPNPAGPLLFEPMRQVFHKIVVARDDANPAASGPELGPLAAARDARRTYESRPAPPGPTAPAIGPDLDR